MADVDDRGFSVRPAEVQCMSWCSAPGAMWRLNSRVRQTTLREPCIARKIGVSETQNANGLSAHTLQLAFLRYLLPFGNMMLMTTMVNLLLLSFPAE